MKMNKLAQKFGVARISVLEKIGKRDTTETEQMQNEAKVFLNEKFSN
jgi:hypothetical protein